MILSLRNFPQIVQDAAAAAQGTATQALNFTVGSVLRVLVEANAGMVLWLQYVALQVLSATRLASSKGLDVDSFVNDYGMTRLPAVASTGTVTFTRQSTTVQAFVPTGTQVKTTDGTQIFATTADLTIPVGTTSGSVTVQDTVAGSAGNVAAGTISLAVSAIPYVDSVTNAVALTNGADGETDAALRARFPLFLDSLSKATKLAVLAAVDSVQSDLSAVITESIGSFVVTVDDGSGSPPSPLLAAVYTAVDAVRPIGTTFSVVGPSVVNATINIVLTVPAGATKPIAAVNTAVATYVTNLDVGQVLPYGRLMQIIFDASPLVLNATLLVNSATADLSPSATGVVRLSVLTVA